MRTLRCGLSPLTSLDNSEKPSIVYSTLNSETNSDSASAKSKGVRSQTEKVIAFFLCVFFLFLHKAAEHKL